MTARLAKIIATVGPATQTPEKIQALVDAGANVIRLNFSHAPHDKLIEVVQWIRDLSDAQNIPIPILGDLQGPKIRTGELENHTPVLLDTGAVITFSADNTPGNATHITTNTPQILEELREGDELLLDDGTLRLEVIKRLSENAVTCRVILGGTLNEKKGINVPGIKMESLSALTEKDKHDALFALSQEFDYLALSFVRSYQDILYLRQFLNENAVGRDKLPLIIAKIEKPQALDEIDAIIETADGIMVARGDLGVELKPERVPVVQKQLIHQTNLAEKPVITATQILESMIHHATPTRAEVSDVANAVFDGSDALMLSGETAMGSYPIEAVKTMATIIQETETHFMEWHHRVDVETFIAESLEDQPHLKAHQVIAQAACYVARKSNTKAIVVLSYSGKMARRIAKRKPQLPIIALTPHKRVYRQLNLLWGLYPLCISPCETTEDALLETERTIFAHKLLNLGDPIVFCAGQTHLPGITNSIKIYPFGDALQQHQWMGT